MAGQANPNRTNPEPGLRARPSVRIPFCFSFLALIGPQLIAPPARAGDGETLVWGDTVTDNLDPHKGSAVPDQFVLLNVYDGLYRYQSNAGPHPTMLAVDLLLEKHPKGLVLRSEPTAQFVAPPVYLHGAWLLYEALKKSGELTPALNLNELPSLGRDIEALVKEWATARMPTNWRELLPREVADQL